MNKPIQPQEKFVIRFPDGMRDRIAEAADRAGRSMNAEIVHRLEQSFGEQRSEPVDIDPQRVVHDAYRRMADVVHALERFQADNKARLSKLKPRSQDAVALQSEVTKGDQVLELYQLELQRLFTLLGEIAIEKARGTDADSKWIKTRARQLKLSLFEPV